MSDQNYKILLDYLQEVLPIERAAILNWINDNINSEKLSEAAKAVESKKEQFLRQKNRNEELIQSAKKLEEENSKLNDEAKQYEERNKNQIKLNSVLEVFSNDIEDEDWNNKLFELLKARVIKKKDLVRFSLAYAQYKIQLKEINYHEEKELEFIKNCATVIENFLSQIFELNDIETRKYILVKVEEQVNQSLKFYEFIAPERNLNFDNNLHETENGGLPTRLKKSKSFCIRNKENNSIYRKANVIT